MNHYGLPPKEEHPFWMNAKCTNTFSWKIDFYGMFTERSYAPHLILGMSPFFQVFPWQHDVSKTQCIKKEIKRERQEDNYNRSIGQCG